MGDVNCKISLRQDMSLYLGVGNLPNDQVALFVVPSDDPKGTDWTIKEIPETSSKILFKRGGLGNGLAVTWVYGPDNTLILTPYVAGWQEQVEKLDELDGGYVAVNNHDRTRVMDRSENPHKNTYVITHPWNGGTNQQWFLHDH